MNTVARFAKAAGTKAIAPAAAAGAVAAAGASSSTAHADCRLPSSSSAAVPRMIKDEWELADISQGKVLFERAELDDATSLLRSAFASQQSTLIEDLDTETTEGSAADEVIELAAAGGIRRVENRPCNEDLQEVFYVANRLLRAPGVQQEMIKAALADPEVFSILNSKTDLAGYLESTGFAAKALLEGPQDEASHPLAPSEAAGDRSSEAGEGSGLLAVVGSSIAGEVEKLGRSLLRISRWMKAKLGGQAAASEEKRSAAAGEDVEAQEARRWGGRFMGAVGMAMVAIVCVALLRRPLRFRAF